MDEPIEVSGGGLRATLAPSRGGRIAGLAFDGVELLWSDPVARGGPRAPFALGGGDKVWIAPQSAWVNERPFAALDLGGWSWDAEASEMRSPVEPLLGPGVRLLRRIVGTEDGLLVETRLLGEPTRPIGLWQVTQLRLPGLARLGAPEVEAAGEANDDAAEPRRVGETVSVRADGSGPWKLSSVRSCRWVEAEVAGVRLRREIVDGPPGVAEVYDSDGLGYWELELHSPMGARSHTERWTADSL